ncbi:hypothetical protein Ahy_B05g078099 [Arachis hypogaea]|uniref:Aminotransferase-like plant mobile domain-containing protein n=1 Tax=Arachis hypogaea TaxID=3818 RepID=A0A444Z6B0_ARAHY|nr:hypothetical protein Ahy_B05g078099 [Arachis hypogaea]
MQLDNTFARQMYVKIHILLLFGTNLFCDKSGLTFLPLLRNFAEIRDFSWGSACLTHLYRTLCRTSRYTCKDVDGPLALFCFVWNPYSHERMRNIIVPNEILQHRLTWSATIPLISFEYIEWHASDRVKRKFSLQSL